jgi:hypothetical protein
MTRHAILASLAILAISNSRALETGKDDVEEIVLENPNKSTAEADCCAAVQRGDLRFFGIPSFQPLHRFEYPGVPAYAEHIVKSHGVKTIKAATGDLMRDEQGEHETNAAMYAQVYNSYLLSQVPGANKPPPGYGIPKSSDVVSHGAELTTGDIAQGRDLTLYDQGGHLDCRRYTEGKRLPVRTREAHLRKFIWDHWKQKRRGYVRETGNSVDAQATFHFFIEPNADEVWHIACRIVRSEIYPTKDPNINEMPEIFSVERDLPKKGDESPDASYVLVFKGKDGSQVMRR